MLHIHSDEVYSFITGGYALGLAGFGMRTFPKPNNKYGLWLLGLFQAALTNFEQSKANFQAISNTQFVDDVSKKLDIENAKMVNEVVLKGTGSGTVSEEDLPKPEDKKEK